MNIDDPRLTAYALDELTGEEKAAMEKLIADSPEAQRFVNETQDLAAMLKGEYAADAGEETSKPANLIDIRDDPWFWSIARPLSIAAVIALLGLLTAVIFGTYKLSSTAALGPRTVNLPTGQSVSRDIAASNTPVEVFTDVEGLDTAQPSAPMAKNPFETTIAGGSRARLAEFGNREADGKWGYDSGSRAQGGGLPAKALPREAPGYGSTPSAAPLESTRYSYDGRIPEPSGEFNTAAYDHILENPFLDAATNPLSTFSIDVDTASYSNIRRFINMGSLPPKDAVRIEELINYFTYDYPQPDQGKPFSISVDVASCPWETSHRLARIGLKGREVAVDKRGASNLVFLLDVSGSMTPPGRLPLVKQAMRLLVEKLTENDRVAIVVYAGASGLALPSTSGDHKEQILSAIEDLRSGGSTNGAEGIELAYRIAAENFIKGGVNRVILATDGDFNVGVTSQGDLVRLIQNKAKTGVFLSVLGVGTDNLKDSTMQKLADQGNGNYAYLDSLDEARKVLVQQMNGTLVTIAKDVKIQVEFNPARVASYRLIGYEKRMLQKEDFNNDKVDAGEIGAGHTVTALYEVVPIGVTPNPAGSVPPVDQLKYGTNTTPAQTTSSNEMLTVKLRHKKPDGDTSELIEQPVVDDGTRFDKASDDFKFAASVAQFGMILRDSEHKGAASLDAVLEWAQGAKGADPNGYRAGFIELVRKAQTLKKS